MATSPFKKTAIAQRYATALYELAKDTDTISAVENDLKVLKSLLASSSDFNNFVNSPLYERDQKISVLDEVAQRSGFQPNTQRTLGVLANNKRLYLMPQLIEAFQKKLDDMRGVSVAYVEVATQMSTPQEDQLKKMLNDAANGKDVRLDIQINPDLLGGMIVKLGSRMIDTSVRTRLHNLESALKETN